ncbi:MarR family winged helix-turn-helix transcriptional regulator [Nocardia sp. NRRL WC-3656]|uniref:MarR family winged helix-turn-helix transcriptional regulator n=1 Tax=Nocardia sp. NRRL WC-3656 TaxID=1463824 RepID=UPI0007C87BDE|nr:MarR family winged helix-turn-helix transcriptional regulator [Nocardia sp. NRRL WC-3656]
MSRDSDPSEVFRRYLSSVVLHAQAGAKAVGLGATDLYALNILELSGAMTPGELGARTGLTTGPTTRLDSALAPARRRIGEIVRGYTPEQRELLFDYFARAAEAYQRAAEDITAGDVTGIGRTGRADPGVTRPTTAKAVLPQ